MRSAGFLWRHATYDLGSVIDRLKTMGKSISRSERDEAQVTRPTGIFSQKIKRTVSPFCHLLAMESPLFPRKSLAYNFGVCIDDHVEPGFRINR